MEQERRNAVEQESRAKVAPQEQENITILCIRVMSLHHTRATALIWCAQKRPEPRKLLVTLGKKASGLWMAWTLGPAAAQVMPREPPLELEALGHH